MRRCNLCLIFLIVSRCLFHSRWYSSYHWSIESTVVLQKNRPLTTTAHRPWSAVCGGGEPGPGGSTLRAASRFAARNVPSCAPTPGGRPWYCPPATYENASSVARGGTPAQKQVQQNSASFGCRPAETARCMTRRPTTRAAVACTVHSDIASGRRPRPCWSTLRDAESTTRRHATCLPARQRPEGGPGRARDVTRCCSAARHVRSMSSARWRSTGRPRTTSRGGQVTRGRPCGEDVVVCVAGVVVVWRSRSWAVVEERVVEGEQSGT